MDEYTQGMEPEVREYLKKVISSFFVGLFWMILAMFFGLFIGFAVPVRGIHWYNIAYYIYFFASLAWVLRYYYRLWRKPV